MFNPLRFFLYFYGANTKCMTKAKIILYKNKRNKTKHPLALRITKNRKSKYMYLGVSISEEDWNAEESRVKKSHPNYKQINHLILKKLTSLDDIILDSEANEKNSTILEIKKQAKREKVHNSFFEFAKEQFETLKMLGKYNDAISSESRIKYFKEFVGGVDIHFKDITVSLLEKFKVYLKVHRGVGERTITNYMIKIRSLYNKAIREGLAYQVDYPFGGNQIKIRIQDGLKIGLDEQEIKAIENLNLMEGTPISHARNLWLFSFYMAGMRISDVLRVRWSDIATGRLNYTMGKNSKAVTVKIPDKVVLILNQYSEKKIANSDFVFPDLKKADLENSRDLYVKIHTATRRVNNYLKEIAKLAKVEKQLSCHISRHSFGNIAGDKISPQMLQKLYRHSDIRTTMGYQANFIHKSADEALDAVLNF